MKNKKKILLYAVNVLLLILIGVCLIRIHSYSTVLLSQQAAQYWKGDSEERFAQVSCFFPETKLSSSDSINGFRKTINSKLADAGIQPREKGASEYWSDCYSATDSLTVKGDRNSSEATAIGIAGDFFKFHPYELLSGSYLSEDDVMKDRVILDYELAWKLFGGDQLEGMTVTINGNPYYIAGVVRRETDKFSDKAFTGDPIIFMSYSALSEINGGANTGTDGGTNAGSNAGTGVSCYEIVMPDPITGFDKSFLTESFKSSKGVVVENSARYKFSSIYKIFEDFGNRSIYSSGVIYPYWENAARISEVYVARLYMFILLLSLFPLICLIMLAVRLIKLIVAKLKILKFELWDAWDDRYARQAAWKERREQKQATGKHHTLFCRIAEFKEQHARKRIDRNIRAHEQKKQEKLPEIKTSSLRKKDKVRKQELPKALIKETADPLEKEIVPDIESIVREVLEEMQTHEE